MRKAAGPGVTFLLALGFTVMGWTNAWVGGFLILAAVIWAVVAFIPVGRLRSADVESVARRHTRTGRRLADRIRESDSALAARALAPEVAKWEQGAFEDLARLGDITPLRGSRRIADDQTPAQVFRPSNVRDLESHLRDEPEGLRPGKVDPVAAYLETKLWWLTLMMGPEVDPADLDRSQAEKVSIWPSDPVTDEPRRAPRNRRYTTVTVQNASDRPVSFVWINYTPDDSHTTQIQHLEVLPPGEPQTFDLPEDCQPIPGRPPSTLRLRFRDVNEQTWEANGAGGLEPFV